MSSARKNQIRRCACWLLPLAAGLLLPLAGCTVIRTITAPSAQAQGASEDTEVVILADASPSASAPASTTAPLTALAGETETSELEGEPSPTPLNGGVSPTTGRLLPDGAVYRPVLVVIDNAALARPQTALMMADIVYEFPLDRDDHSTRYLALFSDELPDRVGPVRTSRTYLAQTAREWGGLYVSLGDPEQADDGYPSLAESGLRYRAENAGAAEAYFYRDKTVSSAEEHTLFFQLLPYVENNDFTADFSQTRFAFEEGVVYEKGKVFQSVGVPFTSSDNERVVFTYDKLRNVLVRSDKNSKKVLGASTSLTPTDDALGYANEPITVQNLIVQYVRVSAYDSTFRSISLTGKGDCLYFVNGRVVFGSWSRASLDEPTSYALYDGTIVRLEPGNTWIMMMPSTREVKIRYGG